MKRASIQSRSAVILCLIAFLMLTTSANWHTCGDDFHELAHASDSAVITGIPHHHHHCVACDMILNNTGCTTFTPTFSLQTGPSTVATVTPPEFVLVSVSLFDESSRSPPSA
ncbi:MAG: hypothetical protein ABFD54_06620 [Armatimonadota bacterium]|nr:hypothetical protein [bacterium]